MLICGSTMDFLFYISFTFQTLNCQTLKMTAGIVENEKTVIQWYQYCRDVTSWWLVEHSEQIGKFLFSFSPHYI